MRTLRHWPFRLAARRRRRAARELADERAEARPASGADGGARLYAAAGGSVLGKDRRRLRQPAARRYGVRARAALPAAGSGNLDRRRALHGGLRGHRVAGNDAARGALSALSNTRATCTGLRPVPSWI